VSSGRITYLANFIPIFVSRHHIKPASVFLHDSLDFALINSTHICGLDESSISPLSLAFTLTLEVKRVSKLANFLPPLFLQWLVSSWHEKRVFLLSILQMSKEHPLTLRVCSLNFCPVKVLDYSHESYVLAFGHPLRRPVLPFQSVW